MVHTGAPEGLFTYKIESSGVAISLTDSVCLACMGPEIQSSILRVNQKPNKKFWDLEIKYA